MKVFTIYHCKLVLLALLFLTIPQNITANGILQNILPDTLGTPATDSTRLITDQQDSVTSGETDSLEYLLITDTVTADGRHIPVRVFDEENIIRNTSALDGFFALVEQTDTPLQVYHIGDSHVAGKVFPAALATKLQGKYGAGKTTLITPKIYSRSALRQRRNAAIRAARAKKSREAVRSTRKKKVSKRRGHSKKRADLLPEAVTMQNWLALATVPPAGMYADVFTRSDRPESCMPLFVPVDSSTVTHNKPGLNFTAFAVNGKSFRYFADNKLVKKHSSDLHPELVIISLGTNDLFGKEYDREYIRGAVIDLIASVRYASPKVSILLTLPADSYVKKRRTNPFLKMINDELRYLATEFNCAYWDPVPVFGGYGIMNVWYKRKLCGRDRIHLTRDGYSLFARKLFEAFEKAAEDYRKHK